MGKQLQLVGQRFSKLIVVKENGRDKRKNVLWLCKCDCGNEVTVIATNLTTGHTQSCGCLRSEVTDYVNRGRAYPEGQAAFNQLYRNYRKGARHRGLIFELTKEDFSFLTKMNCYYCRQEPSQIVKSGNKTGDYIYNGIDRMDSDKGYTMSNVVPCCKVCNMMKGTMSVSDFLKHVEKISLRSK